jgi:ribosomal protein L7/L12
MADPINSSDKEITEIIEKIKKIELGQISKLVEIAKKEFNIKEEVVVQPATAASSAVSEKNKEKETSNVSVK